MRAPIATLTPRKAFEACREFTVLGKSLQKLSEKITLSEDLQLLGIRGGEISAHELIYYSFLKCFYNEEFGDRYSTLVNYD